MKRGSSLLLLASLTAAGCGGGGGSVATTAPPGVQHFNYGIVSADAIGGATPRVVTNGSYGPVVTGVAGAAFTNISITPAQSIDATQIAFSRLGTIYTMNSDGTNIRSLPNTVTGLLDFPMHPTWSRDGRLTFGRHVKGLWGIYICNRDGSNLHRICASTYQDYLPSWSPDNSRIAFVRLDSSGHSQVYVAWSNGTGIKRLSDGNFNDTTPAWSADSSTIFFVRQTSNSTNYIYSIPSIGGTATVVDQTFSNEQAPVASADGQRLAFDYQVSGSAGMEEILLQAGGNFNIDTANVYLEPLSFSPDSRSLLYAVLQNGVESMMLSDALFNNATTLLTFNDSQQMDASWEPFMGTVSMVAASGTPLMGKSASGFLYGLNGNKVTSFATFTAKTPTSATLTSDPISGSATNIIYHLGGDALTNISYVNTISSVPVSLLSATATAKGAVLAFNASTGTVASVLPYSKERPHGTALSDGSISYSGEFLSVFVNGKNVAPSGAHSVRLSPKTGKVLEVR